MKVHKYYSSSGKDVIQKYIDGLTINEQVDALSVLQAFEHDNTEELNIKPWQGKMWEVYFYRHNRIFYVTIDNADVYFLHACRKQKTRLKSATATLL